MIIIPVVRAEKRGNIIRLQDSTRLSIRGESKLEVYSPVNKRIFKTIVTEIRVILRRRTVSK